MFVILYCNLLRIKHLSSCLCSYKFERILQKSDLQNRSLLSGMSFIQYIFQRVRVVIIVKFQKVMTNFCNQHLFSFVYCAMFAACFVNFKLPWFHYPKEICKSCFSSLFTSAYIIVFLQY